MAVNLLTVAEYARHRGCDEKAVRKALGNDVMIGIDPNCGWTLGDSLLAIEAIKPMGLGYIEQPIARRDLHGMAEIRRAAAVALEQEMVARVAEMKAKVVEAEAQVPLAIAEAFRSGHLGVMDYYKMENVKSDTQMRTSIAKPEGT